MIIEALNPQLARLNAAMESAISGATVLIVDEAGAVLDSTAAGSGSPDDQSICPFARLVPGDSFFDVTCAAAEGAAMVQSVTEGLKAILDGSAQRYRREFAPDGASYSRLVVSVERLSLLNAAVVSLFDLTDVRCAQESVAAEVQRSNEAAIELEGDRQRLKRLVTLDGLTGLKNYHTLHEHLHHEWERSQRYRTDISLLLLDLDHFKDFNDSFGHPAGNHVLQLVAEALRATARETDFLARYGGEEFAILLPNTDEAGALAMARRFQAAMGTVIWQKRAVTVSIGVASWSPASGRPPSDPLRLVEHADAALYRAKRAGRNCICQYSEADPSAEGE